MTDYEAFVHELIGYIFKVQDKEDDNLSAEVICRKLYKYGMIEKVNHEWRMKYRLRYRWPARIRKTEPSETMSCEECKHYGTNYPCELDFKACRYEPKTEPQTETEIAREIVHKMIDNAIIAEDAYPNLRQRLHDAVDEYEPQTEGE